MKVICFIIIVLFSAQCTLAQGPRRNRGEGMYQAMTSNTEGVGNWWVTLRAIGFIWDDKSAALGASTSSKIGIFPFGEITTGVGILPFASVILESRPLSYTWDNWFQFGGVCGSVKLTVPDNKELRFIGHGLLLKYIWNNQINFPGTYRVGGTGLNAEGYRVDGSSIEIKYINDYDFIALNSSLPLRASLNLGARIPFLKAEYAFPQGLFSAGVSYVGLGYDFFVEYSIEAFNNLTKPLTINNMGHTRTELHFSENPMFVTLGGRLHYDNGIMIGLYVPICVSINKGSAMTNADRDALQHVSGPSSKFYDEKMRGITDPFDPWYARWKIVGELSFPILYRQTGSEMMRNFLLMKRSPKGKKFDIDEQLKKAKAESDTTGSGEQEKKKRLDDIKKRREQIEKNE